MTRPCDECGKDIAHWHIIPGRTDRDPPRGLVCGVCLADFAATGWDFAHRNDPNSKWDFNG